jgi:hypothetical protein
MIERHFSGPSGSPDSPEWHMWRSEGVGGSDAPVVAADANICKRATWMPTLDLLYLRKIGEAPPPVMNIAMRKGRDFEAEARGSFEEATAQEGNDLVDRKDLAEGLNAFQSSCGVLVQPTFGEMEAFPEIRVSFDGVDFFQLTNAEIKVMGKVAHENVKKGIVPSYYEVQMAYQGLVLWGLPDEWPIEAKSYFVNYNVELKEVAYVAYALNPEDPHYSAESAERMTRLKKMAAETLPLVLNFWKHVKHKIPPRDNLDEWKLAAQDYRKAESAEAIAKTQKDTAKEILVKILDTSPKRSGFGVTVSSSPKAGTVDYKKLISTAVIDREKMDTVLFDMGVIDALMRKNILDKCLFDETRLEDFRGEGSKTVRVTVDKNYVEPDSSTLEMQVKAFEENIDSENKVYNW